ncbi:hypothetical protein U9R90_23555 [Streptomyces sp. E11-3]|uniref:hypothetical protein n=1 Tax=Streptomyces sp. E11-3 TaxID=3110112 RepID=UPI003980BF9D
MSAPTHPRSIPQTRGEARLPWWAIVLPTIAFVALLTLVLHPVDAHAASAEPVLGQLLERVQTALSTAP